MSNAPRISICVPAYNAAEFLQETLASIRAQSFTDWELIVTEDGSNDGTAEIVANFAQSVIQPVRYTRHEVNCGLPATRNSSIAHARAQWIALLDSDDIWTSEHLAACLETAERTGSDLIHGGSILFESETRRSIELRAPSVEEVAAMPISLFDGHYCVQPSSVLIRRDLWERAGRFDPAFRYVEDRDMWLRCVRAGGRITYTGRETCLYRKHGRALSLHSAAMAEAAARVFDKHLDWDEIPLSLRRKRCAHAWAAAGRLHRSSNPRAASAAFMKALKFRWNPRWMVLFLASAGAALLRR